MKSNPHPASTARATHLLIEGHEELGVVRIGSELLTYQTVRTKAVKTLRLQPYDGDVTERFYVSACQDGTHCCGCDRDEMEVCDHPAALIDLGLLPTNSQPTRRAA